MANATLHDIESERALISAMLVNPKKIADLDDLSPSDFFSQEHQVLWSAMLSLGEGGNVFDAVLIKFRLTEEGRLNDRVAAALRIAEEMTLSAANAEYYARSVATKALRRRMLDAGGRIARLAEDPRIEPEALRDEAEKLVMAAGDAKTTEGPEHFVEAFREALAVLQARKDGEVISGVTTGLPSLDKRLAGLQPGQLFILAARPGVGKSALAMQIAEGAAKSGTGVCVFNLEMPRVELAMRSMSARVSVTQEKIKEHALSQYHYEQLGQMASDLPKLALYVDDTASLTIGEIRSRARRLKQRDKRLGLIVVDYLQLVSGSRSAKGVSRQEQVAEISRGLKLLAKELHVPVVALSQLSRDVERGNRRPLLSDLRESGAIEQDADCVMFIHREGDAQGQGDAGALDCELIIAKQRNGASGCAIPLVFLGGYTRFAMRTF